MSGAPDSYGVVGHPVGHSLSPFIHQLFAQQTHQAMSYSAFDVPPAQFARWVREFFAGGGRGLNITLPHKVAALDVLQSLTPRARRAGAVNTLALERGRLLGDNTDGAGLMRDLTSNLGLALEGGRVLLLGAGGAARGVLAPLLGLAPAVVVIANRTPGRATALAAEFAPLGATRGVSFGALDAAPFDLVINATSASLTGELPAVAAGVIGRETLCYDLAYGPGATAFVQWAERSGCGRAVQGLGMLVEQAAESFELWRGVRPATAPVLAAVRERAGG